MFLFVGFIFSLFMRSGHSISDIDISGKSVYLGQLYAAKTEQFLSIGALPEDVYKDYVYREPYYWNQDVHTQPQCGWSSWDTREGLLFDNFSTIRIHRGELLLFRSITRPSSWNSVLVFMKDQNRFSSWSQAFDENLTSQTAYLTSKFLALAPISIYPKRFEYIQSNFVNEIQFPNSNIWGHKFSTLCTICRFFKMLVLPERTRCRIVCGNEG